MKNTKFYQTKLEEERVTVINDLQGVGILKNKRNPDIWQAKPTEYENLSSDSNEVADKIESYEENIDLVQKLEKQLIDIDAALSKIHEGNYGVCEIGKEQIEEERLNANPAARTCKKHINLK